MTEQKLLLTSSGITNSSIEQALADLLGKPISQSTALCVPTAIYSYPEGIKIAWQKLKERAELGWKEFDILELTALPSLPKDFWLPYAEASDTVIVGGGNTFYLSFWMQKSGFLEVLKGLIQKGTTYVGSSAGSMVVTHSLHINREHFAKTGIYYDDEYDEKSPPGAGSDATLKLVDFVIRPHLNSPAFPGATLQNIEKWAAKIDVPLYAIDDQTALKVVGENVEVISEGMWKLS